MNQFVENLITGRPADLLTQISDFVGPLFAYRQGSKKNKHVGESVKWSIESEYLLSQ